MHATLGVKISQVKPEPQQRQNARATKQPSPGHPHDRQTGERQIPDHVAELQVAAGEHDHTEQQRDHSRQNKRSAEDLTSQGKA
jgi:hypothetical protein